MAFMRRRGQDFLASLWRLLWVWWCGEALLFQIDCLCGFLHAQARGVDFNVIYSGGQRVMEMGVYDATFHACCMAVI